MRLLTQDEDLGAEVVVVDTSGELIFLLGGNRLGGLVPLLRLMAAWALPGWRDSRSSSPTCILRGWAGGSLGSRLGRTQVCRW